MKALFSLRHRSPRTGKVLYSQNFKSLYAPNFFLSTSVLHVMNTDSNVNTQKQCDQIFCKAITK
jgi:hypothetical protein